MGMTNTDFIAAIRTLSTALLRPTPNQTLDDLVRITLNVEVTANIRNIDDDLDAIARDLVDTSRTTFPSSFPA